MNSGCRISSSDQNILYSIFLCKTVVHTEFNFVLLLQIVINYRIKKLFLQSKMLTVLKNSGIHVYNSRKLQINSLIFCETLKKILFYQRVRQLFMRWNKRRLFKQQVLNCIIILFYELKQLYCDYYLILQYTCNIVYIVKTKGSKPIL